MSVSDFSAHIAVSKETVSGIINGCIPINIDIALRFSRALRTTAEIWLNLQQRLDLWKANKTQGDWASISPLIAACEQ